MYYKKDTYIAKDEVIGQKLHNDERMASHLEWNWVLELD